jgi:putative drug exporter of the RND superfamily
MSRRRPNITARLARAAAAHPRRTIAGWLIAVVVSLALVGTALNGLSSNPHAIGSPDSVRAAQLLDRAFPSQAQGRSGEVIVVASAANRAGEPSFDGTVRQLATRVRALPGASHVQTYLDGLPGLVSHDGHATLIRLSVSSDAQVKPVVALVASTNGHAGLTAGITGQHTVANDFNALSQHDLSHAELAFGLPAALLVLVLVFGSLVSGLVPVVLAALSIMVGMGLVALLSLEFNLSVFIVNMLTGMGLALGIDYSLFVLSRFREERGRGHDALAAIERSGATASRAVLFSGSTFVVAMFGMLLVQTSVMRSLAAGAIVVGIVSVAAALTLLPALLSLLGDRVDAGRVTALWRRRRPARTRPGGHGAESRMWAAIVARVLKRPGLSLALSVTVMLLAAVPVLGLHIGSSGVSSLPGSAPAKQGYLMLERLFPGQNPYPAEIVRSGGGAAADGDLSHLRAELHQDPRFGPGAITASPGASMSVLAVPIKGDPVAGPAVAAVRDLRAHLIPATFADSGARVYVGGRTAETVDYFDAVTQPTAYVLAFVLGLSFLLLLLAFRSIVVALVSIALNLLSVAAAYGLLTLVFIDGVGSGLFGFQQVHTIEAWIPLFLFSVLFGLSMDYQVFIMSRIKERHDEGASTRDAVSSGVASTARIITGAALIIIVVFAGFAAGDLVMFQQLGFGVAVALLLDATIIRSVVLPSLLALLGERTWYMPRWLHWIPDIGIERAPEPVSV